MLCQVSGLDCLTVEDFHTEEMVCIVCGQSQPAAAVAAVEANAEAAADDWLLLTPLVPAPSPLLAPAPMSSPPPPLLEPVSNSFQSINENEKAKEEEEEEKKESCCQTLALNLELVELELDQHPDAFKAAALASKVAAKGMVTVDEFRCPKEVKNTANLKLEKQNNRAHIQEICAKLYLSGEDLIDQFVKDFDRMKRQMCQWLLYLETDEKHPAVQLHHYHRHQNDFT